MKKKEIDITKYEDFIDVGFKECPKCGWAFDPEVFDTHSCIDMQVPAHNHLPNDNMQCPDDCAYKIWKEKNK